MKFKVGDKVRFKNVDLVGVVIKIVDVGWDGSYLIGGNEVIERYGAEQYTEARNLELIEEEHMTYKEFEEVLASLDMEFSRVSGFVYKNDWKVVYISQERLGRLDTRYNNFDKLNANDKIKLMEALTKLSLTPIEKRVEVKELTVDEVSELLGYKVKIKGSD